jgi:TctA family transporter
MNEKTKSLIRHALTALGVVLGFIGLDKYTGIVQYLLDNLDSLWSAVVSIVGVVLTVIGFFKNKERFGGV